MPPCCRATRLCTPATSYALSPIQISETDIRTLCDMGFDRERAIEQLRAFEGSVRAAADAMLRSPGPGVSEGGAPAPTFGSAGDVHGHDAGAGSDAEDIFWDAEDHAASSSASESDIAALVKFGAQFGFSRAAALKQLAKSGGDVTAAADALLASGGEGSPRDTTSPDEGASATNDGPASVPDTAALHNGAGELRIDESDGCPYVPVVLLLCDTSTRA